MFILGNIEMGLYLVSDEFLIPYMSNIKKDAKQFKRRVDAFKFIEKFENMGFHAEYIHILRMNKE